MMLTIHDVLDGSILRQCRDALARAQWIDGRSTAGHIAGQSKANLQLPTDDPVARQIGDHILATLGRNPRFIAAALPLRILPPRFNRYEGGGHYGDHIDNAIFPLPELRQQLRSDLSCTLFFSEPEEYEGGELIVQDSYGEHRVKLPAGDLVLYPSSSLHRVTPVTRGARYAAFFWIQSLVREDHRRQMLWQLDQGIQDLNQKMPGDPALAGLSGVYHNLLREWAQT